MKPIRKNDTGAFVKRWQQFLRGLGYLIVADGKFALSTQLATIDYQAKRKLKPDGVVGNTTMGTAMAEGFEVVPAGGKGKEGAGWPAPPVRLRQLTASERKAEYGSFQFRPAPTPKNPEAIQITSRGVDFKIVKLVLPQLIGVRGFPKSGGIFVNAKIADQLEALVNAWEEAELLDRVVSWGGSWVARFIRGSRTSLSNHSWGTAFDINVAYNGLGKRAALVGEYGSVRELVPLANKHGFYWGGHFSTRADGMHFEIGKRT